MKCSEILESNTELSGKRKAPVVSVVTVCRNSGETIGATFQSLLDQDLAGMESVVVDGNSTDNTLEIVKVYQGKFAAKGIEMIVVSEPDDGIYDAMNKGIGRCRGELIGILNSDDQYEHGAVKEMVKSASEHPDVGVFYGFLRLLKNGVELQTYRFNYDYILSGLRAENQSAAQHPTCFVRRSVYEDIGLFNTSFVLAADYDFLVRAKSSGVKFQALDVIITTFPLGGASTSTPEKVKIEERYRVQVTNGLMSRTQFQRKMRYLCMRPWQRLVLRIWRMLRPRR